MLAVRKDTIYFSFTAYFLIKEHPAVCEMLLIEFTNREAYAVISCACPLHDCAITVRCKNMSALEELTKELKDKCDILNVSHNVIVSQ